MRKYIFIFLLLICVSSLTAHSIIPPNISGKYTRTDSLSISESLFEEGMALYKQKKYQSAIQKFNEVIEIDRLLHSRSLYGLLRTELFNRERKYIEQYADMWIGSCLHHLGKDSIAQLKNKWYLFEPFDRKRVIISDSLRLKYNFIDISRANKELYLQKNILATTLDSIEFGKYSPRYFESLSYLSNAYNVSREFDKELKVLFTMKDIGEHLLDESSMMYIDVIGSIGLTYGTLWKYSNAIEYLERYFALLSKYKIKIDRFTFNNSELIELANCYIITKQPEKAFAIMRKQVEEKQTVANSSKNLADWADYIKAQQEYALILYNAGYKKEALREYLAISKSSLHPDIKLYNAIACCFLDINDIEHAREYLNKAQEVEIEDNALFKRLTGVTGEKNINIEQLFALTEFQEGNIKKAIDILEQLMDTIDCKVNEEQIYPLNQFDEYQELASTLSNLYIKDHQFEKAIEKEKSNLRFKQKYYKENSPIMGESYFNIGEAYAGMQEYKKALKYTKLAYELRKSHFTNNDDILMNLIKFYTQLGDKKSASHYFEMLYTLKRNQISYYFSELTEREKQLYWEKNHFFFTQFVPKYAVLIDSDKTYEILYNSILDTKGILLDSEKVLRRSILESGDQKLQEEFLEIQEKKQIILNELSKEEDERNQVTIDSLTNMINALEDKLITQSKDYRDLTAWKKCNWKEIQNKITHQDIAIEFLTINVHDGKDIFAALVITKDASTPVLVKLCTKERIIRQYKNKQQNLAKIDRMIWKPLAKQLKGKERIYFSPSDFLYNYGIEYAKEVKDKKVYRLSTTKELITPKRKKESEIDALLVGGLNYNCELKKTEKNDQELQEFESMRDFDNEALRGKLFNFLPYTRKEILEINQILSKEKSCVLLSDDKGTEEAVRYYTSMNPRIIHIATHGAYIQKENSRKVIKGPILSVKGSIVKVLPEDVSLTRSFLLMSGCNSIIGSDKLVNQTKDGVLTAQEISQMDLRGSELVLLSACQTGLGDITYDGVFGLQRGFKRAGAQCLIMSLTKVNDRTTYEFMKDFYEHYMTSNNIKSSFNHSVMMMRKKYPKNPEYWRSFILMDVLR